MLSARWRIASRNDVRIHLAFAASDIAWPIALGVTSDQPVLRALLDRALQQIPAETQSQMRAKQLFAELLSQVRHQSLL